MLCTTLQICYTMAIINIMIYGFVYCQSVNYEISYALLRINTKMKTSSYFNSLRMTNVFHNPAVQCIKYGQLLIFLHCFLR